MSPDLPRLPQQRRRSSTEANSATFAALFGLAFLAIGLLAMVSLVLPQVRGLVVVLVVGVAFFSIHYVVWGRLLTRLREQQAEEEEERKHAK